MEKFKEHRGKTVAIFQPNIDTDQILPKQFLKRINKTGFGNFLFYNWRFDENGYPIKNFILNQERYREASILLVGRNFGSGSSREHATWALFDYGFRVVIAPSFGEIFYNNCFNVGLLPVILAENLVQKLAKMTEKIEGYSLTVNLEEKLIFDDFDFLTEFDIDEFRRQRLLNGWDDIELVLRFEEKIREYEMRRPSWMPRIHLE